MSIGDRNFPYTPRAPKIMKLTTKNRPTNIPNDEGKLESQAPGTPKEKKINTIIDSFAKGNRVGKDKEGKRLNDEVQRNSVTEQYEKKKLHK